MVTGSRKFFNTVAWGHGAVLQVPSCACFVGVYSILDTSKMLTVSLVPSPPPQLSSLAVRITLLRIIRTTSVLQATIAAVEEWERG